MLPADQNAITKPKRRPRSDRGCRHNRSTNPPRASHAARMTDPERRLHLAALGRLPTRTATVRFGREAGIAAARYARDSVERIALAQRVLAVDQD